MELREVVYDLKLNASKIGTYSFTSRLECCYRLTYVEQQPPVQHTLKQVTSNLEYVYNRFDNTRVSDSCDLIRRAGVKSFEYELGKNRNRLNAICSIEKHSRDKAKAKLLWMINRLWLYMLKR